MCHHRIYQTALILPGYILLLLLLNGCASYSQTHHSIQQSLFNHNPTRALEQLEKNSHSNNDLFLYHADKAILLRMLGRYKESNIEIEHAKKIIKKFSASSIIEEGAAFFINDSTRVYIGSPVEQVMLHIYAALNYLELKQTDSARVEILQVDTRLRSFMQSDPDSPFSFDPFARYLSGIIYEDLGEWSDAMIAYRKAYEAYLAHQELYHIEIPGQLKESLILMADMVGLKTERKKYEKMFKLKFTDLNAAQDKQSELIFTFHNGLAPIKKEHSMQMLAPATGRFVRISLPAYYERNNRISKLRIKIRDKDHYSTTTELTENIGYLAIKTLEDHLPAITARALARAVAKDKIAKDSGEKNQLFGLLINIAGVATERADTRSWLTLPDEIQTARLNIPHGKHTLAIELLNDNNQIVAQKRIENIQIDKNKKLYLSFHWIANGIEHGLTKQH